MEKDICEFCGADKENYKEVMGEDCGCGKTSMSNQNVFSVLNLLRRNGISCFGAKDITSRELDDAVRGYG